jgi:choice-of-anchor C domain-containing protein
MRKIHLVAVVCMCAAMPAHAGLVDNGSFEDAIDYLRTLFSNDSSATNINGWKVLDTGTPPAAASIDYIGGDWTPSDGSHSLHLNGTGPGSVGQSIETIFGHDYTLSFDMAGNPNGDPTVKTMDVSAIGTTTQTQGFSFDTTGTSSTDMGWTRMEWVFTADITGLTDLQFISTTDGPYGPALDNVAMHAPVPTAVLLGMMGLGVAGAKLRRKSAA